MTSQPLIAAGAAIGIVIIVALHVGAPAIAENDAQDRPPSQDAPDSARGAALRTPADPAVVVGQGVEIDQDTNFAAGAFPPTMTDRTWHHDAWQTNTCMRCHETGVGQAPMIQHRGLVELALQAKCRTCHVIAPGKSRPTVAEEETEFAPNAFPPMIPSSISHRGAWGEVDCLMCHESGVRDAPAVQHEGLPKLALQAKCRTCHVQVRSAESSPWERR